MRVSSSQMHNAGTDAIQKQTQQMYSIQNKLSSGMEVQTAGDDPVAMNRIMRIDKSLKSIEQFERNGDYATNRLKLEDSSLTDLTEVMQRARELSLQALNGTYTATDRQQIAAEMRGLVDHAYYISNTQDFNGEYIFSGDTVDQQPFNIFYANGLPSDSDYVGDPLGARSIQIAYDADGTVDENDPTRIKISDSGAQIFMFVSNDPNGNPMADANGKISVLDSIIQLATQLENGDPPEDFMVQDLDTAITQVTFFQAEVGTRMTRIEAVTDINSNMTMNLQQNLSDFRDVDYVQGITDFQMNLTALQTSQQIFAKLNNLSLFNYL